MMPTTRAVPALNRRPHTVLHTTQRIKVIIHMGVVVLLFVLIALGYVDQSCDRTVTSPVSELAKGLPTMHGRYPVASLRRGGDGNWLS